MRRPLVFECSCIGPVKFRRHMRKAIDRRSIVELKQTIRPPLQIKSSHSGNWRELSVLDICDTLYAYTLTSNARGTPRLLVFWTDVQDVFARKSRGVQWILRDTLSDHNFSTSSRIALYCWQLRYGHYSGPVVEKAGEDAPKLDIWRGL